MPIEFEDKVLDIDPEDLAERILQLGGQRVGERLMRRSVYDIRAGDESRWIRLREDGTAATLTAKEIAHNGIDGTTETEVVVSDFEVTNDLLGRIGFQEKSYQENRRISFELDGAQLEIDRWPLIPPYLEIEGDLGSMSSGSARSWASLRTSSPVRTRSRRTPGMGSICLRSPSSDFLSDARAH